MEKLIGMLSDKMSQALDVVLTVEEIVFFAGVVIGALAMALLVWIICTVIANIYIFRKAGEGGWKSFVPVYNRYITYKISWSPLWFWVGAVLFIASVVLNFVAHNAVLDVIAVVVGAATALLHIAGLYHLARAFGHGVPFTIGLIFLRPVFILILGFGGSQYQGASRP